MSLPDGWDATLAIAACPVIAWRGSAWRAHRRRYEATSAEGSRRVSGRYNRGHDQYPEHQVFRALYLALDRDTSLAEIIRHVTPELLPALNDYRFTRLTVALATVLDCREITRLGLGNDLDATLFHDTDYRTAQTLAAAVLATGAEGFLVPSVTRFGDNLIVFPDNLTSNAQITATSDYVDPRLFIARENLGGS